MKLYFTHLDDLAWDKATIKAEMREQGLTEIEAHEAIPVSDPNYIWCKEFMEVGERGECGKNCDKYAPKNGKSGCCKHLGKLCELGNKLTIKI